MSHSHGGHSHGHSHSHGHTHELPPPPPYPAEERREVSNMDTDELDKEELHQATVQACFDMYLQSSISGNQRRRGDFFSLSREHQALLPGYADLLAEVDSKLKINEILVKAMIAQNPFAPSSEAALSAPAPTEGDHEKLRSTLRQCVRDWSKAGKKERDETYGPILAALEELYEDVDLEDRAKIRVLVPGAGLARLAWEVVRRGFSCQANEFSLYMLIASSLILNNVSSPNQYTLHPYLHSFSNIRSTSDLLTPLTIPDVLPSDVGETQGDFSFAAGDFLEIYRSEHVNKQDVILTCFFIDTARNIVEYLQTIHRLLKPGGTWINLGPTLWHFENTEGASSVELTMEDVKALARRVGFRLEGETEVQTSYTSNPRSLLRHEYSASFWIARKE